MPKKECLGLYQTMIQDNTSMALLITCKYIYTDNLSELFNEWIIMTAEIGKYEENEYGYLWRQNNNELLKFIHSNVINVVTALLFTTKLHKSSNSTNENS